MNRQQTEDDTAVEPVDDDREGRRRAPLRISRIAPAEGAEPPRARIEIAELPDPLAPAALPGPVAAPPVATAGARGWIRAHHTWQQILGGLILLAACVVAAVWYVPRVLTTDRSLLSGSVVGSGVIALNFTSPGAIDRIAVHPGEHVHRGQVLATEYAPNLTPLLSADAAAIASDRARITSLSSPGQNQGSSIPAARSAVSAARAGLKLDKARLAADRVKLSASRILAPAAGTVTAANGQRGEAATTAGIRDYATDSQRAATNRSPPFSLLPEGPQPVGHSASAYALPVIALRTSSAWQVAALVPESSVSELSRGERVTISVPAAQLAGIPGRISEVPSSAVATSQGNEYQALVTVAGHVSRTPLSGMAANVRLDGPPRRSAG